jgi:hypothetical protein
MLLKMSILKMSSNSEIREKGECAAARAVGQGLWFVFILISIIGNKEFLRVCSFAQTGLYSSLTIFDFVLPSMLPQLHYIFLKALHEDFPQEKHTESNREYLTLTVPCVDLNESDSSYYITVSNI